MLGESETVKNIYERTPEIKLGHRNQVTGNLALGGAFSMSYKERAPNLGAFALSKKKE
jgi:hypothetical protein